MKEECRQNQQKVTGTKPELIERIADGRVLGKIPLCHMCGGGKPRFDAKTGTYTCPGFMEDVDFIRCNRKFSMIDIVREPWEE